MNSKGYGKVRYGGRQWLVHRLVAAARYGGEAIKGKEVHHRCENKRCYEVEHLEVVSVKEHRARHPETNGRRVMCRRGLHSMEGAYVGPDGERACRECSRERERLRREKIRKNRLAKKNA